MGWKAPVLVSSAPLKISRTTADGQLTLTQTFTRNNFDYILKITMTVVNHGDTKDIYLIRLVDIDAANTTTNNFAVSPDTVLGWISYNHGLLIDAISDGSNRSAAVTRPGFPPIGDPCTTTGGTPTESDLYGYVTYKFSSVAPGASKTAVVEYRRF